MRFTIILESKFYDWMLDHHIMPESSYHLNEMLKNYAYNDDYIEVCYFNIYHYNIESYYDNDHRDKIQ